MKFHNIVKTIQIEMRGNSLICGNHTIMLDNIARIWIGTTPISGFGLWHLIRNINNRKTKGVHIECCSGTVYSFIAEDPALIAEAYEMIVYSMEQDEKNPEPEEESKDMETQDKKSDVEIVYAYPEIEDELIRLKLYYEAEESKEDEILGYIQSAIDMNRMSDKEGLKEIFGKFIVKGIISVCNELSLFALIEAIKSVFK